MELLVISGLVVLAIVVPVIVLIVKDIMRPTHNLEHVDLRSMPR